MSSLAKTCPEPTIRTIQPSDNTGMAAVIRSVMTEHGAVGEGFAIVDPEVDHMFETYQGPRAKFYVIDLDGKVIGGGGVAPLKGENSNTCELQKFYFMPQARGQGLGLEILQHCLKDAKEFGFKRCYLETLQGMDAAVALYTKNGFAPLDAPMGNTGHFKCNAWFIKELMK